MSLSNGNGMSPADVAAVVNGGGNCGGMGGWGNNGIWDILVLFLLFALLGNGGFGRGFGGGGGCGCGANTTCATPADVYNAVDQQTLLSKLDQQTYGIADATYALNNAITGGFAQAELSRCNMQAAFMQQLNNMAMADQKCCCETQRLIERGFCDVSNSIHNSTRDIIDNANSNSRAILDFLVKDKIDTLQAENQNLRLRASQADQNAVLRAAIDASTAEIIRRTGNDCPVPAYVVPNPNCCYGNPLGVGYGGNYGGNCGCCA